MANLTPQAITKAVLEESHSLGKDSKYAIQKMIDIWRDAFPIVRYIDDADFLAAKSKKEGSFRKSANAGTTLGLGFDEVWGEDVTDVSAFLGVAIEAKTKKEDIVIDECDLNAHITEGLTRGQLEKTGFVHHGGLVLTFLKPFLLSNTIKIVKGSHIVWRSQRYLVAEITEVVKWADIKDNLYVVCNCII